MKVAESVIKKRKVSKKKKESWRKHIDINDVDNFLEDVRLEERLGGSFSERKDDDLFAIDQEPEKKTVLSKAERRLLLKNKEPRCFAILKPHTAVPAFFVSPKSDAEKDSKLKEKRGKLVRKAQSAVKNKASLREKKKSLKRKSVDEEFTFDTWGKEKVILPELKDDWLKKNTVRHTHAYLGKLEKRKPSSLGKKPSVLDAIEIPHPGTSYNPSYEDHQALLMEVVEKEKKIIKEEMHLSRVTSRMFKKVSAAEKDENRLKEMSEGLISEEKNEESESDDDGIVKSVNPPVKVAKKTLKQRRKIKEQHKLSLELREKKVEKKKKGDLHRLPVLTRKIVYEEKRNEILKKRNKKLKQFKALETKTLSRRKFEAPEIDVPMCDELTGTLRNSPQIGNILKDRFKSLQARNIIVPSAKVTKIPKAKIKRDVKPDHRINYRKAMKQVNENVSKYASSAQSK